jgi:hypothetical protein
MHSPNISEALKSLSTSPNYLGNPDFVNHVGFKQAANGNLLADKVTKEPRIIAVIGRVVDYRLRCGPTGNYSSSSPFGTLADAKFQFYIGEGDSEELVAEFLKYIKTLERIQDVIASPGLKKRNLLELLGPHKNIRFSVPVFQKRVSNY